MMMKQVKEQEKSSLSHR